MFAELTDVFCIDVRKIHVEINKKNKEVYFLIIQFVLNNFEANLNYEANLELNR